MTVLSINILCLHCYKAFGSSEINFSLTLHEPERWNEVSALALWLSTMLTRPGCVQGVILTIWCNMCGWDPPEMFPYCTSRQMHPTDELDEIAGMCDDNFCLLWDLCSVCTTLPCDQQPQVADSLSVTTFRCQSHHRVLQTCPDCTQNQYGTENTELNQIVT